MKYVGHYWQSVGEEEARHNEETEWIRREEKGTERTKT
jgi:hypothetical protein